VSAPAPDRPARLPADSPPGLSNVARFLPAMAARQSEVLALRVPQGRDATDGAIRYLDLTFARLNREADTWAHRLSSKGIARGTRVLMLVPPGLPLIAVCFALFKIGAVPVVVDPGMGLRAFLRCVARTKPTAVVAIPRGIWVSRLFRGTFASVRTRVAVEAKTAIARESVVAFPVAATRSDELAAILFTSGSTGAPKGVCYEHGMFEAQVDAIRDAYTITAGEVDLPMLPVFALFNPALGMTTVVPEINPSRPATVDPAAIVRAITQCGVTTSFGSPVLWRKVVDHCLAQKLTLPTLRRVLSAGAPVPPALMADFQRIAPQATMHSPYGATEALPVTTISDREVLDYAAPLTARGHGTCVGRPVPGVEVRIVRLTDEPIATWRDDLALPPGEIGEIVVAGPQVTRTYDQLPDATALAKIETPPSENGNSIFHRMGDCGYFDAEGRLWFCGRKAERVRSADGDRFTDRCEPVFNQHPAVARCAMIGLGQPGSQEPAIVVETRPGAVVTVTELRELGRACATTSNITAFFFHRRLPVDVRHNAKIHRLALARHFSGQEPNRVP